MGNREFHEATSVLAAWIFLQPFLLCIWNWCIHNTCCHPELHSDAPKPPGSSVSSVPWDWLGAGLGAGRTQGPFSVLFFAFPPQELLLLLWGRHTASYITLHSPTSNVYAWTSCPGLGFTTQNSDLTCQRHFFSFAPSHPHLAQGQPPTEWGEGGVL